MEKFAVDASWTDKDSKIGRFRELYERNDFLTAYSQHTDLRIRDDPRGAIGRADEWESHGIAQRDFLIEQGLKPEYRLLDVGCGVGRAARRLVPFLDAGHYTGCDISREALLHCTKLAIEEGWAALRPTFVLGSSLEFAPGVHFDMLWAHSVFTHLPPEQIDVMVGNAQQLLPVGRSFLFTYKLGAAVQRTGLKQWRYPPEAFECIGRAHKFRFEALRRIWPASQRTGRFTRLA